VPTDRLNQILGALINRPRRTDREAAVVMGEAAEIFIR
jgi:hypothetical protein